MAQVFQKKIGQLEPEILYVTRVDYVFSGVAAYKKDNFVRRRDFSCKMRY